MKIPLRKFNLINIIHPCMIRNFNYNKNQCMKQIKHLAAILCFSPVYLAHAQPVINSDIFGTVGSTYVMKGIDEATFTPGDGGADVTWDFGAVDLNGGTETREVVDAATSEHAADFPGANVATVTDDTSYTYYFISETLFNLYGTATPTIIQAFDEPAELAEFPLHYEDTKSDDFTGSTTIYGFDVNLSGTSTSIADGYGTLILPGGIYRENALRIKVNLDIEGEVVDLPITAEITSTIYYWLIEGNTGPALQYTYVQTSIPGVSSTTSVYVDVSDALLTADAVKNVDGNTLAVYPNPATDVINVRTDQHGYISIYTMNGEKIFFDELSSDKMISTSGLPEGNYLMQLTTETGSSSGIVSIAH